MMTKILSAVTEVWIRRHLAAPTRFC